MRIAFAILMLLLSVSLTACEDLEALWGTPPPLDTPDVETPVEAPVKAPEKPPAPLADMETLSSLLPKLGREGDMMWKRKHRSVPGHFAAHMVVRENNRRAMLITVDDLLHDDARVAQLKTQLTAMNPGILAEEVPGVQLRLLIVDRYEVVMKAQDVLRGQPEVMMEWFEKLRLKTLLGDQAKAYAKARSDAKAKAKADAWRARVKERKDKLKRQQWRQR